MLCLLKRQTASRGKCVLGGSLLTQMNAPCIIDHTCLCVCVYVCECVCACACVCIVKSPQGWCSHVFTPSVETEHRAVIRAASERITTTVFPHYGSSRSPLPPVWVIMDPLGSLTGKQWCVWVRVGAGKAICISVCVCVLACVFLKELCLFSFFA